MLRIDDILVQKRDILVFGRMIYCSCRTDDIQGFALIEKTDLFGRFFLGKVLFRNTAFIIELSQNKAKCQGAQER